MRESLTNEASGPNPALQPLSVLIGTWKTVGTHPLVPGKTFHGRATFDWLEGGAFVVMRTRMDEPEIPSGIAIFGSDETTGECTMLYFDERGVSRKYETSLRDNIWKWWRNAPGFSQRLSAVITDNGRTIMSRGQYSRDGTTWETDLELIYTRVG
jgi:hypothetical protein